MRITNNSNDDLHIQPVEIIINYPSMCLPTGVEVDIPDDIYMDDENVRNKIDELVAKGDLTVSDKPGTDYADVTNNTDEYVPLWQGESLAPRETKRYRQLDLDTHNPWAWQRLEADGIITINYLGYL